MSAAVERAGVVIHAECVSVSRSLFDGNPVVEFRSGGVIVRLSLPKDEAVPFQFAGKYLLSFKEEGS